MRKISNLFLIACLLIGISCQSQTDKNQPIILNEASEVLKIISADIQIVDVRTEAEYKAGHIQNAKLIDIQGSEFLKKIENLNKEKPLLIYCAVGGRSARAVGKISDLGFEKIYEYKGGMKDWTMNKMKIEKGL